MEQLRPIRVVQYGLGATGKTIARMVHEAPGMELVGGIDQNPELVGQDLGDIIEVGKMGLTVSDEPDVLLSAVRPDIAVVATLSLLERAYTQIAACLRARVNVVSTCEELVYPDANRPTLAAQIDELARRSMVSVLGVGVNPGFIMDLLPIILTGPCSCVSRITVRRVVNATLRRASLLQRVGAGLTPLQFQEHMQNVCNRHIGLQESLSLIADAIGWNVDHVDERMEPLIADDWIRTEHVAIAPGQVSGLFQSVTATVEGRDAIVLEWQTAVGTSETYDAIKIEGNPPINLRIEGGLHGDQSAAAMVLHAIQPTVAARCGLLTVRDIPPIVYQAPAQ